MKKLSFLLFAIFSLFVFSSCQKDEDIVLKTVKFVESPPDELSMNNNQCYVELQDILEVKYVGVFSEEDSYTYVNEFGQTVINRSYSQVSLYKIKARKYWNWLDGVQYCSTSKDYYQVDTNTLENIKERVKNVGYAVCYKNILSGSRYDHLGLGYGIGGVVK